MLHAPTIDFRIILYMPYSEQSGQCPSTDNIENSPPPPDFLIPCTNEVQLNRFWKPINDRSWGGGAAYLYYHQEYFGCSWFPVVSFTATTYML